MFGNGLDMRGHVDSTFKSKIKGGIWLIRMAGDYSGPGACGKSRKLKDGNLTG